MKWNKFQIGAVGVSHTEIMLDERREPQKYLY